MERWRSAGSRLHLDQEIEEFELVTL